jgi:hypothetical protein
VAALLLAPRKVAAAILLAWLAAASGWIAWASRRDAAAIAEWSEVIARDRASGGEGAVAMRIGLLERELDYLRRSGRRDDAERTAAELHAIEAARPALIPRPVR